MDERERKSESKKIHYCEPDLITINMLWGAQYFWRSVQKMGINIPTSTLRSTDRTIPLLGYGTAEYPFGASIETMKESILHAIELGYRHFDSASLYQSEVPLGEAISDALTLGLIKSRDELFITSKLWCSDGHKDLVLPALQKTLE